MNGNKILTLLEDITNELAPLIAKNRIYIFRSSAKYEDSKEHSYAGQFKSVSGVKGIENIIHAIQDVWKSSESESIQYYSSKIANKNEIKLAVIIQEMIEPDFSGVVFTKNPNTGIDETIIEAIPGVSENILQQGKDPYRWVYRWNKIIEEPEKRVIKEDVIIEIAQISKQIEKKLGYPLDLEWVYSNDKLWWIQLREITTIEKYDYYSNRISKDHLPGLIKPLIWSINIPLVCGAWITLIEEILGKTELRPETMAKQFFFRAYYNMGLLGQVFEKIGIPKDSLELMMEGNKDTKYKVKPPLMMYPKIIKFVLEKSFFEKQLNSHLKKSDLLIEEYNNKKSEDLLELIDYIDGVFNFNYSAAYYVIISQLLFSVFNTLFRNRLEKNSIPVEGYEFGLIKLEINPNIHLEDIISDLGNIPLSNVTLEKIYSNDKIRKKFNDFLDNFGYLSDNGNDFSEPTWIETPEHVVGLINLYHKIDIDPKKQEKTHNVNNWWLYKKNLKLYELREKISFNYVKSYGLFRQYFLQIGKLFVNKKIIENKNDIFYLTHEQIKKIILNNESKSQNPIIKEIKYKMNQNELIFVPQEIYGDHEPPIINDQNSRSIIKGTPASKGYVKGSIRYVRHLKEACKIKNGEIIVIPFSDISWMPVLTKAGAIVCESGGILSHAAVVSREYGIPAIMGVKDAYSIPEGTNVVIDGYTGTIIVDEKRPQTEKKDEDA